MIISFLLDKVSIEKKNNPKSNIEAKNSLKIINISEESLEPLSKEKVLKFNFIYNVSYEPQVGNLELAGYVMYKDEEKKLKEILNQWNKEKKLSILASSTIFNHILTRCSVKAIKFAQELNLPPHIPFPRISINTNPKNKAS